jgi:hypothetical protein
VCLLRGTDWVFTLLNAQLNPICHLLALLAHHILHISRIGLNIIDDNRSDYMIKKCLTAPFGKAQALFKGY